VCVLRFADYGLLIVDVERPTRAQDYVIRVLNLIRRHFDDQSSIRGKFSFPFGDDRMYDLTNHPPIREVVVERTGD
jgi:hypothetical protein